MNFHGNKFVTTSSSERMMMIQENRVYGDRVTLVNIDRAIEQFSRNQFKYYCICL